MKILFRILLTLFCLLATVIAFAAFLFRDRRPHIYHDVENGDTNAIAKYLVSGNSINSPIFSYHYGGRNVPLLDIAIEYGQLETVDFLLKNKADPNQPDYAGETPLEYVVGRVRNNVPAEKQIGILKTLVAAGADPNRPSSDFTIGCGLPLIEAAEFGDLEMVKALLAAGASVNATNNKGWTALHAANNVDTASALIQAGADRNANACGETPAQTAVRVGNFKVLSVLTNEPAPKP